MTLSELIILVSAENLHFSVENDKKSGLVNFSVIDAKTNIAKTYQMSTRYFDDKADDQIRDIFYRLLGRIDEVKDARRLVERDSENVFRGEPGVDFS